MYELITKAPKATLLVTSRQRLALPNEHLFNVPELSFPEVGVPPDWLKSYDAILLFADRAGHLLHDFNLEQPETQQAVMRICQLLAGYPLALEIAAAWTRWLSLAEIISELEANLTQLEATELDVEDRHRSLHAVFDFSWQMLTQEEQAVLQRVAIFRGGFTRKAAVSLATFPTGVLASLLEKSFIQLQGNGRYSMHNVLQEVALEKLLQNPQAAHAAQTRHWAYFANFLAGQELVFKGKKPGVAFQNIHAEFANIRSGWQFALDTKQFAEMEKTLFSFWMYFGEYRSEEGRRLLQQTVEVLHTVEADVPHQLHWKVITIEIYLIGFFNRKEVIENYAPDILDYFRQHPIQDWDMLGFVILGWAHAYGLIDQAEANRLGDQFIARAKELDDPYHLSRTLQGLSWMNMFLYQPPDLKLAKEYSHESLAVATKHQVTGVQLLAQWQLGVFAFRQRKYEQALAYGRSSIASCRQAGVIGDARLGLRLCVQACLALQRLDEAHQFLREGLLNRRSQPGEWRLLILVYSAVNCYQAQQYEKAVEIISAISQLQSKLPEPLPEIVEKVEEELGTAVYQVARARGKTLDVEGIAQTILWEKA